MNFEKKKENPKESMLKKKKKPPCRSSEDADPGHRLNTFPRKKHWNSKKFF